MIGHSAAESGFIPVRDIPGLIALLDRSEVGTFVLDEIVSDALCKSKFRTCIAGLPDEQGGLWMYEFDGHAPSSALRVTQSLDAALVLAEWVFPGWYVGVQPWFHTDPDRVMSRAYLIRPDWKLWNPVGDYWCDQHHGRSCATPALAVVAAILRAVQHGYEAAGEVSPNLKAKAQGEGG